MKNLVFCCDGTANALEHHRYPHDDERIMPRRLHSNVAHFYQRLPKDVAHQIARYQPGVGTYQLAKTQRTGRLGLWRGKLFGHGLIANIENGYHFLMQHYEPGDAVFLLGFSRGAYAVRALSGMVQHCGLLLPAHAERVPEATRLYHREGAKVACQTFRKHYSQPCPIRFLGVWDTVSALGLWYQRRHFFDARLSPIVAQGAHALAIDEQRPKFEPELWDVARVLPQQSVQQMWFRGAHADVGGGYADRGLAELSLEWMQQEAAQAGLILDLKAQPTQPGNPNGTIHQPWNTLQGRLLRIMFGGLKPRQVGPLQHPSVAQRNVV